MTITACFLVLVLCRVFGVVFVFCFLFPFSCIYIMLNHHRPHLVFSVTQITNHPWGIRMTIPLMMTLR